jgi:hypothetical protein
MVTGVTVVTRPRDPRVQSGGPGKGPNGAPRGPKGPQKGSQKKSGLRRCGLCLRKRKETEKKIEGSLKRSLAIMVPLWSPIGVLREPIKALKGPHRDLYGAPFAFLWDPIGSLRGPMGALGHPLPLWTLGGPIRVLRAPSPIGDLRGPHRGP